MEEQSFFEDLWNMIVERFQANFGEYENLDISERGLETLRVAVIAFFVAIMVAAVIIFVKRKLFGSLVHRLNDEQLWTPEQAKTLAELGLGKSLAVKAALRMGGEYRGLVHCVEEDEYEDRMEKTRAQNAEEYAAGEAKNPYLKNNRFVYDFDNHHFFIPEKNYIEASRRFEKKGSGLGSLILILIFSFLAMLVLIFFLPDMVQLLDNFVGILKD